MKVNNVLFWSFSLFLFFSACQDKSFERKIEENLLKEFGNEIFDYKSIIILPHTGCGGCIREAESYFRENIDNHDVFFILTKVQSLKVLKLELNIKDLNKENIYIDKDNLFSFENYQNSIYPLIIKKDSDNNVIVKIFDSN